MSYLIDTNVLSELRRLEPDPNVVNWVEGRPATTLYLSVLTLGELRKDIEALPEGARKHRLLDWLGVELPGFFSGRVLPIDTQVTAGVRQGRPRGLSRGEILGAVRPRPHMPAGNVRQFAV